MLPIETDVPQLLVEVGYSKSGTAHTQAIWDLSLIAFYYLLRSREYTVKGRHNNTQQTVQFKLEDVTFYKWTKLGQLSCLPKNAHYKLVLLTVLPSSLTTRTTGGKGSVFTGKQMARQYTAQLGHWDGASYTFASTAHRKRISLHILSRGEKGWCCWRGHQQGLENGCKSFRVSGDKGNTHSTRWHAFVRMWQCKRFSPID